MMADSRADFVRRHYPVVACLIFTGAVILTFHALGARSLWLDEAETANNSCAPFTEFLHNIRFASSSPIVLPYIYYLLGDLVRVPFWARALPALFQVASVALIFTWPRAGVRPSTSAVAALLLATAPFAVRYGQEVREYSLSVFAGTAIVTCFLHAAKTAWPRALVPLALTILISPLLSYGDTFLALSVVLVLALEAALQRRPDALGVILPSLAFVIGTLLTYFLTAKFQVFLVGSWHMAGEYPPSSLVHLFPWLVQHSAQYFASVFGGISAGIFGTLVVLAHIGLRIQSIRRENSDWARVLTELRIEAALALLYFGAVLASFLHLYPLGSIRHQIFALPVAVLCESRALIWLATTFPLASRRYVWPVAGVAFLVTMICEVPRQYREIEDIQSAVRGDLASVPDQSVYVFYAAIPAIKYYFPQRRFHYGGKLRGQPEKMAEEASRVISGCTIHILYSHDAMREAARVDADVVHRGARLVKLSTYSGTAVASFTRC